MDDVGVALQVRQAGELFRRLEVLALLQRAWLLGDDVRLDAFELFDEAGKIDDQRIGQASSDAGITGFNNRIVGDHVGPGTTGIDAALTFQP